jgi:poly(3-hydroxybutyrate) depolymerase
VSGLCAPIPACSASSPCPETTTLTVPTCTTTAANRPPFNDAPARQWLDAVNGEQRAACVFKPAGTAAGSLRPLVIFLHGSAGLASNIYNNTLLRQKAASYILSGDPARPGFVLASDQGRNLPNPNGNLGAEERHDIYFRDFGSPSANPDFRNLDRLVDELVAEGGIDTKRIYATGWSNGAFFAQQWGMARHATATPGGNKIAAVVSYAGADPLQNTSATQSPSCAYSAAITTALPILNVHRWCDSAVGCNAAQEQKFSNPPGYDVQGWIARLKGPLANPNTSELIIDDDGNEQLACRATFGCGSVGGLLNHVRWPDGVADNGGHDWEPAILDFFKAHPLP